MLSALIRLVLNYLYKSKVYSKKAVQEYVQYEEAELKAFEAELKTKGLLSLR